VDAALHVRDLGRLSSAVSAFRQSVERPARAGEEADQGGGAVTASFSKTGSKTFFLQELRYLSRWTSAAACARRYATVAHSRISAP